MSNARLTLFCVDLFSDGETNDWTEPWTELVEEGSGGTFFYFFLMDLWKINRFGRNLNIFLETYGNILGK